MDFVNPILDIFGRCWDCTDKHTAYIRHLEDNLDSLRDQMTGLKNITEDVKRRVEHDEQQQMECTNEVKGWLDSVKVMEDDVSDILQKGAQEIQKKCAGGCCPKNCRSSYKLGKIVSKKLEDVRELSKEEFDVVAVKLPRAPVEEKPMEDTVGLDLTFEEAWRCIEDRSMGIIGLYGTGGVGKTTLLKKINNEFLNATHDFSVVIWVVVSRQGSVERVQELIRRKLEISDRIWSDKEQEERAEEIFKVLRRKKFILLLDDLWERLDLSQVGIPLPNNQNGSKVVFTTRSKEVCGHMEAIRSIRVEILSPEDALKLFNEKVGEDRLKSHPDLPRLAQDVAAECKGLPLALITVGRSMASRNHPRDWEYTIEVLKSYPSKFSGMEDVYRLLEFSYDKLASTTLQSCFLYCSLFPEDYNIEKDELIDLWIGEGFLDEFDARNNGEHIIGSLKLACLLESGEREECVKMHDVIRDMALWLARERGDKMNKVLVIEGTRSIETHGVAKLMEAEKISLWGRIINELISERVTLQCRNLSTLLIRDTKFLTFSSGFFASMPALRVLDLSRNWGLTELPDEIGDLINLQYLNLSYTGIQKLPLVLKNLRNLRCLLLNHLNTYPFNNLNEVISSLSSLQVLSFLHGPFASLEVSSILDGPYASDERSFLEVVECLEHMKDLRVGIATARSAVYLFKSPKLQRCIRMLTLRGCPGLTSLRVSSSSLGIMEHLEILEISLCQNLKELTIFPDNRETMHEDFLPGDIPNYSKLPVCGYFRNLRQLHIYYAGISDVSWVVYAPSLQTLSLKNCNSLKEVVIGCNLGDSEIKEENMEIFSRLATLHLSYLPNLKSICQRALPFPCLIKIRVFGCPNLKTLPFDSNSAKNSLKQIQGHAYWWNELQWDDETTKHAFSSKYVEI